MTMTIERTRVITGATDTAWLVISDMAGYADHVDGLATTTVKGSELGALRRCVDTSGAEWQETCVAWQPGSSFTVEVDVASYPPKFKALFSAFRGTWWVRETAGETAIGIRFEAELRSLATAMRGTIERRIGGDLDRILDSYARSVAMSG